MNERQEHYGLQFYKDHTTGYWISTTHPRIRAHRWVWQSVNGKIPKDCHIHHIDEDKSNNDISNLRLMTKYAHLSMHMTEERRAWSSSKMDEIRHLTKEWHASEEGRAWHKYHAIKNKFGKWETRKLKCEVCSKEYETTKRSKAKFCSNACKSKFRRDSGLDDVIKDCLSCLQEFSSNKYAKNIYCSKLCAQKRKC